MYKKLVVLLSVILLAISANAQVQLVADTIDQNLQFDSLRNENSVLVIDTITPKSLRLPDSLERAAYLANFKKGFGYEVFDLKALMNNYTPGKIKPEEFQQGTLLPKKDSWVLAFITFLLVLFALLKNKFSKELIAVVQSFYSNRALGNLNKEENLFTSWSFLLLFVQFGFTIGMFFYLVTLYKNNGGESNGFQFFLKISVLIIVLYLLKIVVLRLMGFIFSIQKPINEYVSILYLSYFNASLLFIPLVVAFALSPIKYGSFYLAIGIVLLSVIFAFQIIRAGINILSQYRFSKVYLFLYFCTLEICPILILIKAIGL